MRVSDDWLARRLLAGRPQAFARAGKHVAHGDLALIQMMLDDDYNALLELRDRREKAMTDKCPKSEYKDDRHDWVERLASQEYWLQECAGCGLLMVSRNGWVAEKKNWVWTTLGYIAPSGTRPSIPPEKQTT